MRTLEILNSRSYRNDAADLAALISRQILPDLNLFIRTKRRILLAALACLFLAGAVALAGFYLGIIELIPNHLIPTNLVVIILVACLSIMAVILFVFGLKQSFKGGTINIQKSTIPFTLYEFRNGTVLVDETSLLRTERIVFPELADSSTLVKASLQYKELIAKLPVVLGHELYEAVGPVKLFDRELELQRIYQKIKLLFSDLKSIDLRLGIFRSDDELAASITAKRFRDAPPPQKKDASQSSLRRISGIIRNRATAFSGLDSDHLAEQLEKALAADLERLNNLRSDTLLDKLNNSENRLAQLSLWTAYNFFCPYCHAVELAKASDANYDVRVCEPVEPVVWNKSASLRLLDLEAGIWFCQSCKREITTPISLPKLYTDIFSPLLTRLLQEHQAKRQQLYAGLADSISKIRQQSRLEADTLIQEVHTALRTAESRLEALKAQAHSRRIAIATMRELLTSGHQNLQSKLLEIEQQADQGLNRTLAKLDGAQQSLRVATEQLKSDIKRLLDEKLRIVKLEYEARDRPLKTALQALAVNPESFKESR